VAIFAAFAPCETSARRRRPTERPQSGTGHLSQIGRLRRFVSRSTKRNASRCRVRQRVAQGLRSLADQARGEATHAQRAILLTEPPSIDANEITDKGSVNQRAVLARRAAAVTDLYRTPLPPEVIIAL